MELMMIGLGNTASAVCTAFWNSTTKSDMQQDTLYRGGARHSLRTPRLVCVDFTEGSTIQHEWRLGCEDEEAEAMCMDVTVQPENERGREDEDSQDESEDGHEEEESESAKKDERVQKNRVKRETKKLLQNRATLPSLSLPIPQVHPRSVTLLSDARVQNSEGLGLLHSYPAGADNSPFKVDEVFDNIRYFTEECDSMQGYIIVSDSLTGFGGLTNTLITHIQDDFGKLPIFTTAVHTSPTVQRVDEEKTKYQYILNTGFSTAELAENSSTYVPITVPKWSDTLFNNQNIRFPDTNQPPEVSQFSEKPQSILTCNVHDISHTAALIASTLDTVLLGTRIPDITNTNAVRLNQICAALRTYRSMSVTSLYSMSPIGLFPEYSRYLSTVFEDNPLLGSSYLPLSHSFRAPDAVMDPSVIAKVVSVRGGWLGKLPPIPNNAKVSAQLTKDDIVNNYVSSVASMTNLVTVQDSNYGLSSSTPLEIFHPNLTSTGWMDSQPATENPVYSIGCGATLCTSTSARGMLKDIATEFKSVRAKFLLGYGRDHDEWVESKNLLETLVDEYNEHSGLSDDDGSGID